MILIILGTRAEYIKMFPLIKEMDKQGLQFKVIATGQHNLEDLNKKFKRDIIYLTTPPDESSRFGFSKFKALKWAAKIFFKLNKLFSGGYYDTKYPEEDPYIPDYILAHGDTMSTAIISLSSFFTFVPLIHIESGLNSFNIKEPFPEEIMRRIAIKIARYHFAPTKEAVENLKGKKNVYFVGNTIFDLLKDYKLKPHKGNYVVASIHRQENMNSKERMRIITNAMNYCNRKVILFAHDPFLVALKKFGLGLNKNVEVKKLVNHKDFLKCLVNCDFVIGDGGSIQEECAYFKKPYVMMRAWTERKNIYTKLGASKKIVEILKNG